MATEGSTLVAREGPLSDAIKANKAHFLSSVPRTGPHNMANSIGRDFDNNRARILIGYIEGWGISDSLYLSFVTGLTIGYGDLTPRHLVSRFLAVVIGPCRYWVDRPHSCD
jgi:hypothetical protein